MAPYTYINLFILYTIEDGHFDRKREFVPDLGHFLKIRLIQIADPGFETFGKLFHGVHGRADLAVYDPANGGF